VRTAPGGGGSPGLLGSLLHRGPVSRLELLGLVALCAAVVASTVWVIKVGMVLGHDESVYATMARSWLGDGRDTGVAISRHRAPLLPVLGLPVLAAGGGDLALRGIGVASAVGMVVAVWWVGRSLHGPAAGLIAAAVVGFAPSVFGAGTLFLTDLPAAALLVALAGLLWSQFALREQTSRMLLLAAPLAWAAYLLRYGSALVVVLLSVTTVLLFWPEVRRAYRHVAETAALLVLLLIPHLVNATIQMGAPWARVLYTSEIAGRDYLGQGLREYLGWFPEELAGRRAAALMTIGLIGCLALVARRGLRAEHRSERADLPRALAFLVVPAGGHLVAIGIASHGDPRFVFFAIAMLCIAGAVVVTVALEGLSRRTPRATWAVLVLLVATTILHVAQLTQDQVLDRDQAAEGLAVIEDVGRALGSSAGGDCSVLTSYSPQITWYSGCATYGFSTGPEAARANLTDDAWVVLFQGGKRQPEGADLGLYLAGTELIERWEQPHENTFGWAELYRFTASPHEAAAATE
jgi:4-amino-4-deoxy-L-arabinose transferase-like glycosyltransferase